jgi:hypothetical protein
VFEVHDVPGREARVQPMAAANLCLLCPVNDSLNSGSLDLLLSSAHVPLSADGKRPQMERAASCAQRRHFVLMPPVMAIHI